jgi:predicted amidohydrolase
MSVDRPNVRRRSVLRGAGLAAAASVGGALGVEAAHPSRRAAPAHAVAPLRGEITVVAALQLRPERVDPASPRVGLERNLRQVVAGIARAQAQGPKDLVALPADALQGPWPVALTELERVAITLDGPERAALSACAQDHRCFVAFGALLRDPAWPGHVVAVSILLGPDGGVLGCDWAPLGDADAPNVTTIERVHDRFVAVHGPDAVLPVHRTTIGNVAFAPSRDPDILRALALKGAEIVVRTTPTPVWDGQAASAHNRLFGVVAAAARDAGEGAWSGARGASAVYGPNGEVIAEAGAVWQQVVTARLPMAHFRATRRAPTMATALVLPAFEAHRDARPLV